MKKLQIETALQIQRPKEDVFEAIVDPEKMTGYFISKGSGRMESGKTLIWEFPEFEGESTVRVGKIRQNEFISFFWDIDHKELLVEIELIPQKDKSTLVKVKEGMMDLDDAGLKWLKENTAGWANFLACLKAYLEHGINLRKGAFDFMRK